MDTRSKRSSAVLHGLPWRGQYPAPDSTIAQADRQHIAWLYAGVLAADPTAALSAGMTAVDNRVHEAVVTDLNLHTTQATDTLRHTIATYDSVTP